MTHSRLGALKNRITCRLKSAGRAINVSSRLLIAALCVVPLLLFGAGCYTTQYPLGSADQATVQQGYIGDFVFVDGDKLNTIVIRNIDNRLYYVEWINSGEKQPDRMVGYTDDVNGVTFANLRGLTEDGTIDNKYLIMRISLSADHAQLTIRNLKEDFFKDKKIDSSDSLTKVITANLENDQMYDGEPTIATRVTAPNSQPSAPAPGM
jgi:hypothetical protein